MSVHIPVAFVEQYQANVNFLSQQRGSRLRRAVPSTMVTGRNAYFDQIGATAAVERTTRHADTPRIDTPHSRRRVSMRDFVWSDLIDDEDKVRMLRSPASEYVEAAGMAMGRSIDDVIIAAADGIAYTGVDGGTATAFDTGMVVGVQTRWPGVGASDLGLNVAKILEAKRLLGAGNVDSDEERWMIINSAQEKSLIQDARVASHDFNTLKPLADGMMVKYHGFNIISTERIGVDASLDHKVLFLARGGLKLGVGKEITTRIDPIPGKNYSTQVWAGMTIGATRMEEARVGYIACDPTLGPGA